MATTRLAPSDSTRAFIDAVRDRMDALGMKMIDLSAKTGIGTTVLSRFLNHKGGSCTFATADKIAEALNTTLSDLLHKKS